MTAHRNGHPDVTWSYGYNDAIAAGQVSYNPQNNTFGLGVSATEGNEKLYCELQKIDPESAAKIHPNDAYRICRALEVYYLTGQKRSSFKPEGEGQLRSKYDFLFIVLEPQREVLYERIRQRVDLMFEAGLEKEIRSLLEKGYTKDTPGMKAIGYSEWFEASNIEEIREAIKHHSCKYAKKQYTYIRDIPGSTVIDFSASPEDFQKITAIIKEKFKGYFY